MFGLLLIEKLESLVKSVVEGFLNWYVIVIFFKDEDDLFFLE